MNVHVNGGKSIYLQLVQRCHSKDSPKNWPERWRRARSCGVTGTTKTWEGGGIRYRSSTKGARWASTAPWLMVPLSVLSPASNEGEPSTITARTMRLDAPVELSAKVVSNVSKVART